MKYENDEFLDEFYATVEPVIIANCLDCRDETELLDGIICWTCSFERSEIEFFETVGWSDGDALASAGYGMDEDY
jgi:hypothetical protein